MSPQEPPCRAVDALRFLGPGFILSAAVVGSGELIATTALGARAGYSLLWVVLASCLVKVTVQLEYGRYCIVHGRPSLQAWNADAGPRLGGRHWSLYAALAFLMSTWFGAAGMMGAAAEVVSQLSPRAPLALWLGLLAAGLSLLVFHGRYRPVELGAGLLNLAFVSTILYCNIALLGTAYAYALDDLVSGLRFQMPAGALGLAAAVFGITGVGSGEIVMYPYWCLEKGYAAWTGPRDGSEEWARRARGWIRVMKIDALMAMAAYTIVTCGFYLLGAALLRPQGGIADGNLLVAQLSRLFTAVLGEGSRAVFMVCAASVLFSSLFSNTAGLSRLWADLLGIFRLIDVREPSRRRRAVAVLAWILPAAWALVYLTIQKPLFLVTLMGISNAAFLLVVGWQAARFRYRHSDPRLRPSAAYDVALWLSLAAIVTVAVVLVRSAMR